MKEIYTKNAPKPIGPYSQAVLKGKMLFISGQIGIQAQNDYLEPDFKSQMKAIFTNIKNILIEVSMDFDNILKVTIFMRDLQKFGALNEYYSTFFHKPFPAREVVEVSNLPKNAELEISVIASV